MLTGHVHLCFLTGSLRVQEHFSYLLAPVQLTLIEGSEVDNSGLILESSLS